MDDMKGKVAGIPKILVWGLVLFMANAVPVYGQDLADLLKRAEAGEAAAQVELGLLYERGEQVTQNDQVAFQWLEKAALSGHAEGQFYLGWMYANGYGVPKDNLKAFYWFSQAKDQGHQAASDQRTLLIPNMTPDELSEARLETGEEDVEQQRSRDAEVAKLSDEFGWDYADLRRAYNQRRYEVVPLLSQLARNGQPEAQNLLGYHLLRLARSNPNDEALPQEAFKWFLESAKQGFVPAQYNLGVSFLEGTGVARSAANAERWFAMAKAAVGQEGPTNYQDATAEFREASEYSDRYAAAMQGYRSAERELRELIEMRLQESKARRSIE